MIETSAAPITKVGNNPLSSAMSYAGFVLLWFCTFMADLGAENNAKQVKTGMIVGSGAIALTLIAVSLALIANIEAVAAAEIPSAVLAEMIAPWLAPVFIIITICGIYTTSVPLLWTVANRIKKEGTSGYRAATVILAFAGAIIALFLPYQKLVNVIYGINGYVGIALIVFMLAKHLRLRKKTPA